MWGDLVRLSGDLVRLKALGGPLSEMLGPQSTARGFFTGLFVMVLNALDFFFGETQTSSFFPSDFPGSSRVGKLSAEDSEVRSTDFTTEVSSFFTAGLPGSAQGPGLNADIVLVVVRMDLSPFTRPAWLELTATLAGPPLAPGPMSATLESKVLPIPRDSFNMLSFVRVELIVLLKFRDSFMLFSDTSPNMLAFAVDSIPVAFNVLLKF